VAVARFFCHQRGQGTQTDVDQGVAEQERARMRSGWFSHRRSRAARRPPASTSDRTRASQGSEGGFRAGEEGRGQDSGDERYPLPGWDQAGQFYPAG